MNLKGTIRQTKQLGNTRTQREVVDFISHQLGATFCSSRFQKVPLGLNLTLGLKTAKSAPLKTHLKPNLVSFQNNNNNN